MDWRFRSDSHVPASVIPTQTARPPVRVPGALTTVMHGTLRCPLCHILTFSLFASASVFSLTPLMLSSARVALTTTPAWLLTVRQSRNSFAFSGYGRRTPPPPRRARHARAARSRARSAWTGSLSSLSSLSSSVNLLSNPVYACMQWRSEHERHVENGRMLHYKDNALLVGVRKIGYGWLDA